MEQGSSSAPNQKRQCFDDLRAIVISSSQDLSHENEPNYSIPETNEYQNTNFDGAQNLSQSEQIQQQIGGLSSSFSRRPLGTLQEMLSQFHGADLVDLSAAYSLANLHSRPQLFHGNNAGQESNYGMMNRYSLSASNVVPQSHLLTSNSSGNGGRQNIVPQSHLLTSNSSGNGGLQNIVPQSHLLTSNSSGNGGLQNVVPQSHLLTSNSSGNGGLQNVVPQSHLSTSNSSGNGGLQNVGSSQTSVPFESSMIGSSFNTGIHNAYPAVHEAQNNAMPPENTTSFRSMRSQGLPYSMSAPNNSFDVGVDISNNANTSSALKEPLGSSMTEPSSLIDVVAQQAQNNAIAESSFALRIPYPMNSASGFDSGSGTNSNGPSTSSLKRKMPSQDDMTTNYPSWNTFGRGLHRYSSSSYDGGRYTLYDKRYEDVGLPVDPHLRIFIAGNGNGESSSSRRKD